MAMKNLTVSTADRSSSAEVFCQLSDKDSLGNQRLFLEPRGGGVEVKKTTVQPRSKLFLQLASSRGRFLPRYVR